MTASESASHPDYAALLPESHPMYEPATGWGHKEEVSRALEWSRSRAESDSEPSPRGGFEFL